MTKDNKNIVEQKIGKEASKRLSQRDYNIVEKYLQGRTFTEIGKEENLSRQRVQQIYTKIVKTEKNEGATEEELQAAKRYRAKMRANETPESKFKRNKQSNFRATKTHINKYSDIHTLTMINELVKERLANIIEDHKEKNPKGLYFEGQKKFINDFSEFSPVVDESALCIEVLSELLLKSDLNVGEVVKVSMQRFQPDQSTVTFLFEVKKHMPESEDFYTEYKYDKYIS